MSEEEYYGIYDLRFLIRRRIMIRPTLMRTLGALLALKKASADEVAKSTGRPRTIESKYLSELNKIGLAAKVREGRKVIYIEPVTAVREALQTAGKDVSVEQLAHSISLPADIVRVILDELKRKGA
ncbi:MAG: transcriptional regulator [Desulfurococcaceae archaeon]